jgi:hypothetical protein
LAIEENGAAQHIGFDGPYLLDERPIRKKKKRR